MSWRNPFEKREIKKPEGAVDAPKIIARDALGNPIGTADSSIAADQLHAKDAQEWKEAA
jgi:hypothetical protein